MEQNYLEHWKFINSFAPWFSALSSFIAVTVALYFSVKDRKLRLKITMGYQSVISTRKEQHGASEFFFIITNTGQKDAIITRIYWSYGIFRKKAGRQPIVKDGKEVILPKILKVGHLDSLFIKISENKEWLDFLCNGFLENNIRNIYTLKMVAETSIGKKFCSRM